MRNGIYGVWRYTGYVAVDGYTEHSYRDVCLLMCECCQRKSLVLSHKVEHTHSQYLSPHHKQIPSKYTHTHTHNPLIQTQMNIQSCRNTHAHREITSSHSQTSYVHL